MSIENPPAFPRTGEGFGNPNYDHPGMTLRELHAEADRIEGLNSCSDCGARYSGDDYFCPDCTAEYVTSGCALHDVKHGRILGRADR
jgi:hypothetical protein